MHSRLRGATARADRPPLALELLVVLLLVVVYDRVADLTRVDVGSAVDRGRAMLRWEAGLHLFLEHGLVAAVAGHRLLSQVLSLYYDWAHVTVVLIVGAWLYLRRPAVYRRARTALLWINLVALSVFVVLPVAPPRLIPGAGIVDVVARSGTWGSWAQMGATARHAAEFAAMPSLHIAWASWVALAVRASGAPSWARRLSLVHVGATVLVVLATGNHYVVDVAAGAALAGVVWAVTSRSVVPVRGGVLVVTASMGAGHDGVAYELARRWEERGTPVRVVDFLAVMPLRTGALIRRVYSAQLHHAPRTYEWLYDAMERHAWMDRAAGIVAGWARGRLLRMARRGDHRLVVSTYPLAGRAVGQLRREGRLAVPAVTFLTDVDVHTTWLDEGTDLYLAVYDGSAAAATRRTGQPAQATGPVLPPHHDRLITAAERVAARFELGLTGESRPVALLVTGSWGVGDVASTALGLQEGGVLPLVLCGRNDALRRELADQGVHAVGWTDDVRSLYAAADVVVHNAGGLSSLEAMAAGVPVIGHACLPGHGHRNARAMADAGVAAYATDTQDLVQLAHALAADEGRAQSARARALFAADPIDVLTDVRPSRRVARTTFRVRRTAALGALLAAAFAMSNVGVSEASEHGIGVARAPQSATVFAAVQLDDVTLADPRTPALLRSFGVSALVAPEVARDNPLRARALTAAGLTVLADFPAFPHLPGRGSDLCEQALATTSAAVGAPVLGLVSVRGLPAWPLAAAHLDHIKPGVAVALRTAEATPSLHPGEQVVVEATADDLSSALTSLARSASQAGLAVRPLASLWASA